MILKPSASKHCNKERLKFSTTTLFPILIFDQKLSQIIKFRNFISISNCNKVVWSTNKKKKKTRQVVLIKNVKVVLLSHRRCSVEKAVLNNFMKYSEKHLCQSLYFNKVEGWRLTLWHSHTETLTQKAYELCKNFESSCFIEHLRVIVSEKNDCFWKE